MIEKRDVEETSLAPPRLVCVFIASLAFLHLYLYYPHLPEVVASHFNAAGHADGWMPKRAFAYFYLGGVMVTTLLFTTLPWLLERLPAPLINLPRRDYWLAPERVAATRRLMSRRMLTFGTATLLFLMGMMELVFTANLSPAKMLPLTAMWVLLGSYCIFALWWAASFIRTFARTGEQGGRRRGLQ